jgi:hypothetical protein
MNCAGLVPDHRLLAAWGSVGAMVFTPHAHPVPGRLRRALDNQSHLSSMESVPTTAKPMKNLVSSLVFGFLFAAVVLQQCAAATSASIGERRVTELKQLRFGMFVCWSLSMAFYFSEGQWAWPDQPDGGRFQVDGGCNPEMKRAQFRELLPQYGLIEYIRFDHAIGDSGVSHEETVAFCKALQPDCFIGFNHGNSNPPAIL